MSGNRIWRFQLPGTIEWRLKDKTPREVIIGPAPGWTLLTPYATLTEGFWDAGVRSVIRLPNGDLWVRTDVLTLSTGIVDRLRSRFHTP
jgi:hypothetical protein